MKNSSVARFTHRNECCPHQLSTCVCRRFLYGSVQMLILSVSHSSMLCLAGFAFACFKAGANLVSAFNFMHCRPFLELARHKLSPFGTKESHLQHCEAFKCACLRRLFVFCETRRRARANNGLPCYNLLLACANEAILASLVHWHCSCSSVEIKFSALLGVA